MNKLMPNEIEQSGMRETLFDFVRRFPDAGIGATHGLNPSPTRDITANYHHGNPQSVAANRKVDKAKQTKRILGAIRGLKGATSEEVENNTGLQHQSVSARMSELKRNGLIVKIGLRKTSSGCNAGVWKIK